MTAFDDSETRRANIAFIKRSMETPLLSREHEYALARAWRDENNDAALHELINAYNRLVVSTAGRFRNYGLPMGDLIQEGVVGLLHAANRFEPDRDVRFSTYASWWIRSAMQDFILRNWSIVRIIWNSRCARFTMPLGSRANPPPTETRPQKKGASSALFRLWIVDPADQLSR